jgi:uncharacterized membrane protein
MTPASDFILVLLAMGAASYACRAGGFFLMRFVTVTPRLEAALKVLPLGVMIGIAAPALRNGGMAEILGLIGVVVLMKVTRNDVVAALGGIALVALCRELQ